ncbi:PAS domain S-box protein [Desulfosporosinus shakirovi]|uniref:PAS domain S-box protein n=1 Tax=Desulfosporosinus shakirovi TaxID=2885154 RepID=UPI001E56C0E2|nr:PAS domain S-box protein [Desulfosporosinus sp. SRJS8]MCB8815040.1 PAS domain S-box protein [Desulfosporosinus sp. SRJS8]
MSERIEHYSMDKYQEIYFFSPTAMIIIDIDTGDIAEVNQTAIDYYGYSTNEFLRLKIFDIDTGEPSLISEWMKDISRPKTLISKHRLKSSEIRDVEISSRIINLKEKKHIILSMVDVTERLQVEKELRENRERLELVLSSTKSGIWDYNMINDSAYMDKQWKGILGYEEHELTSGAKEWQSRWHPEDNEKLTLAIQQSRDGKTDHYEVEHRMLHKDGSYRWVNAIGKIIRNEKGQPVRAVGVMTDITKMKETESRILESENKLRDFAQAIPDNSAIVDEDGCYVEVFGNSGVQMESSVKMQGMTFHQLFPQDLADLMLEDVSNVVSTGENKTMIREMYFGSEKRYIEGRIGPMQYRINGKRTVVVVISDITGRFEVDQMLKFTYELQRKSDFINDILSGMIIDNKKTHMMAKEIGITLDSPLYCCLILLQGSDVKNRNNQNSKPSKSQMNQILYLISTHSRYIVWDNRDKIGVLCQDGNPQDSWENSMKAASELKEIIGRSKLNFNIIIGISDIHCGTNSIKDSYQEASNTLISAQCQVQGQGGIYYHKDVGLFQILSLIYGKDYSLEFVRKMVGPLIEHDSEKGSDLLITLEEILQNNSLKDAANKLFIHYKTLFFRKQRLEKILGVSLDNVDIRLALAIAIKLHKLMISNPTPR